MEPLRGGAAAEAQILTAEDRDVWAALREKLEADDDNAKMLATIDAGILVVCLDDAPISSVGALFD